MPETPYKNLETNKDIALVLANNVANTKFEKPTLAPLDYIGDMGITAVIEELNEQKDRRNNIAWYRQGDHLVRDGREARDSTEATAESDVIRYLNNVRGAISILTSDPDNPEKLDSRRYEAIRLEKGAVLKVQELLEMTPAARDKEISSFNTELVVSLTREGIKDAEKKIDVAKNYAGLDDKHYHITTLSQLENGTIVIESEIKTSELTQPQKEMFNNLGDQEWFKKMPTWEQALVREYQEDFVSGTKVIPTQLRSSIPLLRNAYHGVTSTKKKGEKPETILETSHSGSISCKTKAGREDNIQYTRQNIEQLQQFTLEGKGNIHITSLMSPINFQDEDANDESIMKEAVKRLKYVTKSTLPYNNARLLFGGGRKVKAARDILVKIGENLERPAGVAEYLKTGNGLKKARESIKAITNMDSKTSNALENAITAREDIDYCKSFFGYQDKGNLSAKIASTMNLVTYAAREGHLGEENKDIPMQHCYCKSGKDRTMALMIETTFKAVTQAIEDVKDTLKSILCSRSACNLAGTQGGTPGCDSIRPAVASYVSKEIFAGLEGYFTNKIAELNTFKVSTMLGEVTKTIKKTLQSGTNLSSYTRVNKKDNYQLR